MPNGGHLPSSANRRRPVTAARRWAWHGAALFMGAIVFLVVLIVNDIGVDIVLNYTGTHGLYSQENWPIVAGWNTIFYYFEWLYPAAVASCFVFAFWNGLPAENRRLLIYASILAVIGPLTFVNYTQSDQLIDRRVQVVFNLFTVFFGLTVVLKLKHLSPKAYDARALRSLAVLLIAALCVALPLFYTGVFGLVLFGWIDHHQAQAIGDYTALGISGAVGAIAALLENLDRLGGIAPTRSKLS
jgi:hypothetical protein